MATDLLVTYRIGELIIAQSSKQIVKIRHANNKSVPVKIPILLNNPNLFA